MCRSGRLSAVHFQCAFECQSVCFTEGMRSIIDLVRGQVREFRLSVAAIVPSLMSVKLYELVSHCPQGTKHVH